ncbi:N-acetylmuramoyl-L-alanine amidase [Sinanaerobacter sp. ZZT-01]|uniref:N-acetylmuramoyl-L-alanine amidase n=1 Tax=Sinanaerobacter sp. ZZT-01 TaxID=3111540 RepID=UPI002D77F10C|nr:N-acetylmuramoyl-L-alanine amidase [Sinanaerobacter sp. ZZT-01]WRR92260.1 N-acetylmuramoyl-L-alanine amidase [Sinanaerobacter sp. ZZT-01]
MPSVYLSPSVEEENLYINGGTEECIMNLIVDTMIPYLNASNIIFERNNPNDSLAQVIAQSNLRFRDLHLSIHSTNAPKNLSGLLQGPDVYYYAYDPNSKKAAETISKNLATIYPNSNLITEIPTVAYEELRRTKSPAVLVNLGYHDNFDDAQWIKENISAIAKNLSLSLAELFGTRFSESFSY